jgi:hypothetical protein
MTEGPKLLSILKKLNAHFKPPKQEIIEEEPNRLKNDDDDQIRHQILQHYQLLQQYQDNPQSAEFLKIKELFVDPLIDFFLEKNQERLGGNFDKEKERKQRSAIKAMLEGKHLQGETGLGKDSVILPIVAIIESLTSPSHQVILSSAKDEKVKEYPDTLNFFINFLPEEIRPEISFLEKEGKDSLAQEDIEEINAIKKEMFLEVVEGKNGYKKETLDRIRNAYWKNRFLRGIEQPQSEKTDTQTSQKPVITVAYERDLVFKFAQDSDSFSSSSPRIFLDEAHIPYDRNTPYVVNAGIEFPTFEGLKESIENWILARLINERLADNDFVIKNGQLEVEESKKGEIFKSFFQPIDEDKISSLAQTIIENFGLSEDKKNIVIGYIKNFLTEIQQLSSKTTLSEEELLPEVDNYINRFQARIEDILMLIPLARFKKGHFYVLEDNQEKVRDEYTGTLLPSHQFMPLLTTVIGAVNNQFVIPSYDEIAICQTHYQTFIYWLRDKITFSSGTLLVSTEKGLIKGPFAHFIENITGREIYYFPSAESKNPPSPYYFEKQDESFETAFKISSDRQQPTLIVCFNENDAQALKEKFSSSQKRVVLLSSLSSEEEENSAYQQLANGEIDIVISSGKAAEGVDIKKQDGQFPNLHVMIFGLPPSRLKLRQTLGRRRAQGDDFSWILTKDHLGEAISSQSSSVSIFSSPKKYLERILSQLENNNGKQIPLKKALEFIQSLERLRIQNDEYIIFIDRLSKLFQEHILDTLEKKAKEKDISYFVFGLPSEFFSHFVSAFYTSLTTEELTKLFDQKNYFFNKAFKDENLLQHPLLEPLRKVFFSEEYLSLVQFTLDSINSTIANDLISQPEIVMIGPPVPNYDSKTSNEQPIGILQDKLKEGDVVILKEGYVAILKDGKLYFLKEPNNEIGIQINDEIPLFLQLIPLKSINGQELFILFFLKPK